MDKLEQFIKENRNELDRYEPGKNVWRGIRTGLKTRRIILPVWLSAAAAVVLIIGTSVILYSVYQKKIESYAGGNTLPPALKETEVYYNSLVNALYTEAKPLLTGQPEIAMELNTDMAQLDSICIDIKKDLKDNVANQEVVEALIRLQLLEEMLALLKENQNGSEKNKSHEL
jgi:hypothetical protein